MQVNRLWILIVSFAAVHLTLDINVFNELQVDDENIVQLCRVFGNTFCKIVRRKNKMQSERVQLKVHRRPKQCRVDF